MRFIQTLILMQRTRYIASVWSKAFASAVSPYSAHNDQGDMRSKWLSELEARGLVQYKVGGFIWIDTYVRTLLRGYLGTSSERVKAAAVINEKLPKNRRVKTEFFDRLNPVENQRSIHECLAYWYEHVLVVSNSPACLFEAVYHACQSAVIGNFANSSGDSQSHTIRMIEWATALLGQYSFLAQTRGYSRGSTRSLKYIWQQVRKELQVDRSAPLGSSTTTQLAVALTSFGIRCVEVMRAISREVGELDSAYAWHRDVAREITANPTLEPGKGMTKAVAKSLFGKIKSKNRLDPCVEWLRWCRWNAMLANDSRSYAAAYSSLRRAARSIGTGSEHDTTFKLNSLFTSGPAIAVFPIDMLTEVNRCIDEKITSAELLVCGVLANDQVAGLIEVARVVEQSLATAINFLNLCRRKHDFTLGKSWSVLALPAILSEISGCLAGGEAVVRRLRTMDLSTGSSFEEVAWCESRLYVHHATFDIINGELGKSGQSECWQNAMESLLLANGSLNISDPRRFGTDLAMVELFRGEAKLREAEYHEIVTPIESSIFRTYRCKILTKLFEVETAPTQIWVDVGATLKKEFFSPGAESQTRVVISLVNDALKFLSRAEMLLTGRRRNVSWTTWLFERKLTAASILIWASLFEKGNAIRVLGIEESPLGSDTAIDRMLDDAARMIPVDPYRLASIVIAYGECACAFRCRLLCSADAPRLPDRQRRMHYRLSNTLMHLERVVGIRERSSNVGRNLPKKHASHSSFSMRSQPDGEVTQFVVDSISTTKQILVILEVPLV